MAWQTAKPSSQPSGQSMGSAAHLVSATFVVIVIASIASCVVVLPPHARIELGTVKGGAAPERPTARRPSGSALVHPLAFESFTHLVE